MKNKTQSNFLCLPQYRYRVRVNNVSIHTNLTRGQFNTHTGNFIGFIHVLNHKDIDILVQCDNPNCQDRYAEFWTELLETEEHHLPVCDVCEKLCQPVA